MIDHRNGPVMGPVLFLTNDAPSLLEQLAGRSLPGQALPPLRDDVSTDEIIPLPAMVHFDAQLGRYPYTGLTVQGQRPIGPDAIRNAGIRVVVGGRRYGKGSSREHSVVAELSAGVRLVIARGFERIYRQNADNLGLWTSTDFSLLEALARGQPVTLEQVLEGRDPLAQRILRAGGLLAFGRELLARPAAATISVRTRPSVFARAQGLPAETLSAGAMPDQVIPATAARVPSDGARPVGRRPRTLFEKIVDRHRVSFLDDADSGVAFVRTDRRFLHEYYTGMIDHLLGGTGDVLDPGSVVCFEDHLSYVHESPVHVTQGLVPLVGALSGAHRAFVRRHGLRNHGYRHELPAGDSGNDGSQGISHAMMTERYALPGELIAGTDSHTPHLGAVGCVALGVGSTDMANALLTGLVRIPLAPSLLVRLHGALPAGVMAKDVILHLLARDDLRGGAGVGKVFEFAGEALAAMPIDERATLTNMTAELGGLTGIVAPDWQTTRFLAERRGAGPDRPVDDGTASGSPTDFGAASGSPTDDGTASGSRTDFGTASGSPTDFGAANPWPADMRSDPDARYAQIIDVNVSRLGAWVARPGDPGNGLPLTRLPREQRPRIDIAYGGSCTAGKRSDFDAYHQVLAWALIHGHRLADGVELLLQCATEDVRRYCDERGYSATFEAIGARLLQPACGACANCGPGVSTRADQVTVSAINRNFPGRSGPGQVWLASPATVAASAVAGSLMSFAELVAWRTGTCVE
ncbi:MAG: aconitase family protein [Burkholderiaceae bacterium]